MCAVNEEGTVGGRSFAGSTELNGKGIQKGKGHDAKTDGASDVRKRIKYNCAELYVKQMRRLARISPVPGVSPFPKKSDKPEPIIKSEMKLCTCECTCGHGDRYKKGPEEANPNVPPASPSGQTEEKKEPPPMSPRLSKGSGKKGPPMGPTLSKGSGKKGGTKGPPMASTPSTGGGKGGKGSLVKPRKPDIKPKATLRRLFWESFRINDSVTTENLWLIIDQDIPSLDTEYLESLFVEKVKQVSEEHDPSHSSRVRKIRVLPEQRRKQIFFMLACLPSVDETCLAISDFDVSKFTSDHMELLLLALPAQDEIDMLRRAKSEYTIDETNVWDKPEDFMLSFIEVRSFKLRLQLMAFVHSFPHKFGEISSVLEDLSVGCNCMLTSYRIRHLIGIILTVGNYLNGGTPRGRADGFSVATLAMLKTLKTTNGKGTVLDYVLEQMESLYPGELDEMCAPDGDLHFIRRAGLVKYTDILEEMGGFASTAKSILHVAREGRDSESASFSEYCETMEMCMAELDMLQVRVKLLDGTCSELSAWFFMKVAAPHAACDSLFQAWAKFANDVTAAREASAKPRGKYRRKKHRRSRENSGGANLEEAANSARHIQFNPRISFRDADPGADQDPSLSSSTMRRVKLARSESDDATVGHELNVSPPRKRSGSL